MPQIVQANGRPRSNRAPVDPDVVGALAASRQHRRLGWCVVKDECVLRRCRTDVKAWTLNQIAPVFVARRAHHSAITTYETLSTTTMHRYITKHQCHVTSRLFASRGSPQTFRIIRDFDRLTDTSKVSTRKTKDHHSRSHKTQKKPENG